MLQVCLDASNSNFLFPYLQATSFACLSAVSVTVIRNCMTRLPCFVLMLTSTTAILYSPLDIVCRYASVRAIETKSQVDDQQWLTYWVLYSFITLFELTFAPILEW